MSFEEKRGKRRMNMLKEMGFYKGVNLGGWFSQCDYSRERLDNFITEKDFAQIAAWGFDHVRIPIDYNLIQNRDGSMIEEGLARIDRASEPWSSTTSLSVTRSVAMQPNGRGNLVKSMSSGWRR